MFIFFRQIRQRLLSESKFSRYLAYALGEVILVVVGILIALQIDNWNDNRKEYSLAIQYLEGINSDLNKDISLINQIIKHEIQPIALIRSIADVHKGIYIDEPEYFTELLQPNTSDELVTLFRRGKSFRAIRGTYHSLISDGKSGLIKNRQLFGELQLIYDEQHTRLDSIYDSIKNSESQIAWAYSREKYHWSYEQLALAKDEKIFLDLANFTELKLLYCQWLILLRRDTEAMLIKINQEIDTLQTQ